MYIYTHIYFSKFSSRVIVHSKCNSELTFQNILPAHFWEFISWSRLTSPCLPRVSFLESETDTRRAGILVRDSLGAQ